MDESKLRIEVQETANGFILEYTRWDETVQFVFARYNPVLRHQRAVFRGDLDPFEKEGSDDS
jgi:hypothetical protein